jgi:competence protein ComFC
LLKVGTPIYICEKCTGKVEYYNNCVNSLNLPREIETYCDGMVCVGKYSDSLKNSLKSFKFSNKPSYYRAFGKLLALKVQNTIQLGQIDMIIPVPLHRSRQKQRGYNQSYLIGECVAKLLCLPLESTILVKSSESKSQSVLSRNERLSNVEGLFKVVNADTIYNKNILIIDDIVTTGSTVNQCSKALKQAGASSVIAGVIATTRN